MSNMSFHTTFRGEKFNPAFTVERIDPPTLNGEDLKKRSEAIRHVLASSWEHKFVDPHLMSSAELEAKIPGSIDQWRRIMKPSRSASYSLAYTERNPDIPHLEQSSDAHAMMRVEEYRPRNPFKQSYPNITDLETISGSLSGEYEKSVAALLYLGLNDFLSSARVSIYSEEPNEEGIAFLENLDFHQTGNRPKETIGDYTMTYVQLEATSVAVVRNQVLRQYPLQ